MKTIHTTAVQLILTATLPLLLLLTGGCSSIDTTKGGGTGTEVQLTQQNYSLICAGATGKSYGFWLLGLIPITSPSHAVAKQHLYQSVGQPLTGKAIALANQTEDRSTLYLILFSIPRIYLTADVIEFTGEPKSEAAAPSPAPVAAPAAMPVAPAAATAGSAPATAPNTASGLKN